ncbi:LAMI_0C02410g1_1 [Lachancea mirantina]|uniref:LAMI_0C02410g1_1 n=1 Tax=Lachancea mirantina TaxID=1230905 RepID=A0A1G4J197_9SACH|nr:LAMI_0C02410g1_1 [Lachancea mirantina]
MDQYRGGKRSSISFGSYQRPSVNFNQSASSYYTPRQVYAGQQNSQNGNRIRSCNYEASFPLFALDWSTQDYVALGSYKEDAFNKLQIIHSADLATWDRVCEANVVFPISRVQWCPDGGSQQLATCSDSLRLWTFADCQLREQVNLSLRRYNKGAVATVASVGQLPPVTSFQWNAIDTNMLISSSIDTTCTVWDLQSPNSIKTQLIAHDSEVFDVKFLTQSTQLFTSCGGDGSVRVFDLRSLAHSTIIYELMPSGTTAAAAELAHTGGSKALLRLEPSPFDPNVVATFAQDSNSVVILDMRFPGSPVLTLTGHTAAVNQIQWHPFKRNVLFSCGDDCQALYWDLSSSLHAAPSSTTSSSKWNPNNLAHTSDVPQMAYNDEVYEINNLVLRPKGDWLGCTLGRQFQGVRV